MLAKGQSKVHYSKMEFTYDGKEKAEYIEWTEKTSMKKSQSTYSGI